MRKVWSQTHGNKDIVAKGEKSWDMGVKKGK